jgi:hypothetical protein
MFLTLLLVRLELHRESGSASGIGGDAMDPYSNVIVTHFMTANLTATPDFHRDSKNANKNANTNTSAHDIDQHQLVSHHQTDNVTQTDTDKHHRTAKH